MKKLIKEVCTREGKKVQVSRGNVQELLKVTADILTEEIVKRFDKGLHPVGPFNAEWGAYCNKKLKKKIAKARKRIKKVKRKIKIKKSKK